MLFDLEKRHLDRITSEEATNWIGIPVGIADLCEFPHWETMRRTRRLEGIHFDERMSALEKYLLNYGLKEIAEAATLRLVGGYYFNGITVDFRQAGYDLSARRYTLHPDVGFKYAKHNAGEFRWLVDAGKPSDHIDGQFIAAISREAVVLVDGTSSPRDFWNSHTKLPNASISHNKVLPLHRLFVLIHELQHLKQLFYFAPATSQRRQLFEHFNEINSDIVARASINKSSTVFTKEGVSLFLRENLFMRYASLLTTDWAHQIAYALDLSQGSQDNHYDEVRFRRCLDKIYYAIDKRMGHQGKAFSTDDTMSGKLFDCREGTAYSFLRRCLNDGEFAQGTLEEHVTNKVLEGVEYFSRGLTMDPSIVTKSHYIGKKLPSLTP